MSYSPEDFPTVANPVQPVVNLCAIGDSRTALNHAGTTQPFCYRFNNGVINQAMAVCRERLVWKTNYNLGVSGDTAQGIDGRKTSVATLMATRPASEEWDLVYWVDINDAIGGVASSVFLGYFQSTMKYFMGLGIRNIYVLSGIPYPQGYGGETTGNHATRIALIKAYNTGMQAFCANSKGLHFIDNYYDYGGGTDVPQDANGDIHPGIAGAYRCGFNLGNRIIAVRGLNTVVPGQSIAQNPKLESVETITSGGGADTYFCVNKTNTTLSRDTTDGALVVALDGSTSTAIFQVFCTSTTLTDTLMPGDILQGVLDCQIVSASGQCEGAEIQMKFSDTTFAEGNWVTSGYAKYALPTGRMLYLTDPYEIPASKAGLVPQSYLVVNSVFTTGNPSACTVKVYECSPHRTFVSPNAEYSANATIPAHRKNIACLTNTATGAFTLTLPPLATTDDGDLRRLEDIEGAAATHNVTIKGNASELIIDGASGANTKVLSTNYFTKTYRADHGAAAWVAV